MSVGDMISSRYESETRQEAFRIRIYLFLEIKIRKHNLISSTLKFIVKTKYCILIEEFSNHGNIFQLNKVHLDGKTN